MANNVPFRKARGLGVAAVSVLGSTVLTACATPTVRTAAVYTPPATDSQPFMYAVHGQTPAQVDRDRYECYVSAVRQTGVDPNRPSRTDEPVVAAPAPAPGAGTATGAVGGAVLGSLLAGPRSAGLGFLLGGVAGAAMGSAADANVQAQVTAAHLQAEDARATNVQQVDRFRQADSACLSARGYSVG